MPQIKQRKIIDNVSDANLEKIKQAILSLKPTGENCFLINIRTVAQYCFYVSEEYVKPMRDTLTAEYRDLLNEFEKDEEYKRLMIGIGNHVIINLRIADIEEIPATIKTELRVYIC